MKRILTFIVLLAMATAWFPHADAQTRSSSQKTKTTQRSKTNTTAQRKGTTKKKSSKKSSTKSTAKTSVKDTPSIKGLKNESAQIKKKIKEQERRLQSNARDVKKRLQNLMVINTEIADKRKTIDTIRHDINMLDDNISELNSQLDELSKELQERRDRYVKSIRYMHRNRSIQNQLMFIFSAKNFTQMFRRMRFVREYATYQRAQGEMVKEKRAQVAEKRSQLTAAKAQKNKLLDRGIAEHRNLENKQEEQQKVVKTLQKEQKTIQRIIDEQRKKDAAINAQIDHLISIEIEKARQRAIAEAKRKAEAEAARKRAKELAKKKAAADKKTPKKESNEGSKEAAEVRKESSTVYTLDSEDRRMSGNFENNKGRLPMPVAGQYRIVSHFGQYNVEGLKNVTLDNKGINILGSPGAQVRSIFDGEVSAVFSLGGTTGVMMRHGSYISVYCNLGSVHVRRGQKVSTRQAIGTVGSENILQFQLRRETSKLNPEVWLGR